MKSRSASHHFSLRSKKMLILVLLLVLLPLTLVAQAYQTTVQQHAYYSSSFTVSCGAYNLGLCRHIYDATPAGYKDIGQQNCGNDYGVPDICSYPQQTCDSRDSASRCVIRATGNGYISSSCPVYANFCSTPHIASNQAPAPTYTHVLCQGGNGYCINNRQNEFCRGTYTNNGNPDPQCPVVAYSASNVNDHGYCCVMSSETWPSTGQSTSIQSTGTNTNSYKPPVIKNYASCGAVGEGICTSAASCPSGEIDSYTSTSGTSANACGKYGPQNGILAGQRVQCCVPQYHYLGTCAGLDSNHSLCTDAASCSDTSFKTQHISAACSGTYKGKTVRCCVR